MYNNANKGERGKLTKPLVSLYYHKGFSGDDNRDTTHHAENDEVNNASDNNEDSEDNEVISNWDTSIQHVENILAVMNQQKARQGHPKWLQAINKSLKGAIAMVETCQKLENVRIRPATWGKDSRYTMYYKM